MSGTSFLGSCRIRGYAFTFLKILNLIRRKRIHSYTSFYYI